MIHYITSDGLGQPWVGNELRIVTQNGIPVVLHAMRSPKQLHFDSKWAQELAHNTQVLYPLPVVGLVISTLVAPFLFRSRWVAALINAAMGKRENLRARISAMAHFFVACHWARRLRVEQVSHIHSQWAYSSGTIGMYGAWLLGKSFSFTGHAADLFRDRVALGDKIRRAAFIVCISEFHRQFFLKEGARPEQLRLVYCGIDVSNFSPAELSPLKQGLKIRAAGRLVEKKGFEDLIRACALLRENGVPFECLIGGSGPLEEDLRNQVTSINLTKQVRISGEALKQEDIPEFMHNGNVFCLPCVWAKDNDVDGLPQMLMEAMACGLPVVSTRLVGIPDLVIDGKTGIVVEPRDTSQLADALRSLQDQTLADQLASAGRNHVVQNFEIQIALQPLLNEYRRILDQSDTNNKKATAS